MILLFETDRSIYKQGEKVRMKLTVRNPGPGAVKLEFRSAQQYDFVVKEGEKEIWRWSSDKVFAMMIMERILEPGKSISYKGIWDQRDSQGRQVPPGRYEALGVLTSFPARYSDPFGFEIR